MTMNQRAFLRATATAGATPLTRGWPSRAGAALLNTPLPDDGAQGFDATIPELQTLMRWSAIPNAENQGTRHIRLARRSKTEVAMRALRSLAVLFLLMLAEYAVAADATPSPTLRSGTSSTATAHSSSCDNKRLSERVQFASGHRAGAILGKKDAWALQLRDRQTISDWISCDGAWAEPCSSSRHETDGA